MRGYRVIRLCLGALLAWALGSAVVQTAGKAAAKLAGGPSRVQLAVGQEAPDFELPRLTFETSSDGKVVGKVSDEKVKLLSLRGKPVFLVFSSYT